MPKLLEKFKVLGGRAEVLRYEKLPNSWYYREKIPYEKAYRTRKISNVSNKEEAEDAAILIYAELSSQRLKPKEKRIKKTEKIKNTANQSLPVPSPRLSANAAGHGSGRGGAYLLSNRSKPERSGKFINRKRRGVPIDQAVDDYIEKLRDRVEANELGELTFRDLKQTYIVHLKPYFSLEGIKSTADINLESFHSYPLYRKGCSKLTKNKEARQIKGFVDNYLSPKKLIDVDVATSKKLIPLSKVKQEDLDANPAINEEDWTKINSWIRNVYVKNTDSNLRSSVHYWRYLFWHFTLIMKNSGARPNELLNLRWNDIQIEDVGRISQSKKQQEIEELEVEGIDMLGDDADLDANTWAVNPEAFGREERLIAYIFIKSSKIDKPREVPTNLGKVFKRFKEYQETYIKENNLDININPTTLIFGNPHKYYSKYTYPNFTSSWHKCMQELSGQLKGHKFSDRSYTIYSMRSSFVEKGLLKGMDVFLLSRICGHSVDMLQRHYERIDVKERAEEITKISFGSKKKKINKIDLFSN